MLLYICYCYYIFVYMYVGNMRTHTQTSQGSLQERTCCQECEQQAPSAAPPPKTCCSALSSWAAPFSSWALPATEHSEGPRSQLHPAQNLAWAPRWPGSGCNCSLRLSLHTAPSSPLSNHGQQTFIIVWRSSLPTPALSLLSSMVISPQSFLHF